jgi:predicted alpha/beta hydrolase family esterase
MKRAIILHGTSAQPTSNWFPWLKTKLESEGYEVWVPQLPDADAPNRDTYGEFLLNSGWDFTDSIVIGHSSGAVEVLNLLMDRRMPRIRLGVMVGAWMSGAPKNFPGEPGAFAHLFPRHGFKFRRIRGNAGHLAFLHGSDDPYCPIDQAVTLATRLKAPMLIVPDGGHLGAQYTELPQVWGIVEPYL